MKVAESKGETTRGYGYQPGKSQEDSEDHRDYSERAHPDEVTP
jgi:hypothetical protein